MDRNGNQFYILGIAGSTVESAAALSTVEGELLSSARGKPLSLQEMEEMTLFENMRSLLVQLQDQAAPIDPTCFDRIRAVTCSIEGMLSSPDMDAVEELLKGTLLHRITPPARFKVLNHRGEAAHLASFWGDPGIVIKAGTSAWAYGMNLKGDIHRAGGWGPFFDEDGGGFSIGYAALKLLSRMNDGRERDSDNFTIRMLAVLGCAKTADVFRKITRVAKRDEIRVAVADVAKAVSLLADEESNVCAIDILKKASDSIFDSFRQVARTFPSDQVLPVVLQGALLENSRTLLSFLTHRIQENYPLSRLQMATFRPVVGSLIRGLKDLELEASLDHLKESLRLHRELWQPAGLTPDQGMLYVQPSHNLLPAMHA